MQMYLYPRQIHSQTLTTHINALTRFLFHRMQLQPPQLQIVTDTLSSYGVKYNGNPLSRSQQQQLLHPDDDSRRSSKRGRSSNNQDSEDLEMKRLKQEPDTRGTNTPPMPAPAGPPTLPGPPGPPPPPNIPPGFGQNVLSQINITQLPVHHVVDIIFETLAANHIPHLFHSFLVSFDHMKLLLAAKVVYKVRCPNIISTPF